MNNKDGLAVVGTLLSLVVNALFFAFSTPREIGPWQNTICTLIPLILLFPLFISVLLAKMICHGEVPIAQWDMEEAKKILLENESLFKRILSRIFLCVARPVMFIGGWVIGSLIFYSFVQKYLS
jgi:Na+/melibiose symporter-like transporter